MDILELKKKANEVRKNIVTAVHAAKAGHPGGALSSAEIFTYLYFKEMNIDPADPKKADRDRFVLSKGHSAPGLYAVLAERGYFPKEDLLTLRHTGSYLQGHPDMKHIPGVDMSSGSLGQGISAAVGMALSAKLSGDSYRVYTLLGDGEIQEGQVWEASMFAGHRKLDNLVVIVDNNNLQIDGAVDEVCSPYPIDRKFEAFNFHVIRVEDGNDMEQIEKAFEEARQTKGAPTAIIAKTLKGKGVSFMENKAGWHGKAPNEEEYGIAMKDLEAIGEKLEKAGKRSQPGKATAARWRNWERNMKIWWSWTPTWQRPPRRQPLKKHFRSAISTAESQSATWSGSRPDWRPQARSPLQVHLRCSRRDAPLSRCATPSDIRI